MCSAFRSSLWSCVALETGQSLPSLQLPLPPVKPFPFNPRAQPPPSTLALNPRAQKKTLRSTFSSTPAPNLSAHAQIHTPDSSRYWLADSYGARHAAGQEPQNIDKEFLRLWFRERCDPYKDEVRPPRGRGGVHKWGVWAGACGRSVRDRGCAAPMVGFCAWRRLCCGLCVLRGGVYTGSNSTSRYRSIIPRPNLNRHLNPTHPDPIESAGAARGPPRACGGAVPPVRPPLRAHHRPGLCAAAGGRAGGGAHRARAGGAGVKRGRRVLCVCAALRCLWWCYFSQLLGLILGCVKAFDV